MKVEAIPTFIEQEVEKYRKPNQNVILLDLWEVNITPLIAAPQSANPFDQEGLAQADDTSDVATIAPATQDSSAGKEIEGGDVSGGRPWNEKSGGYSRTATEESDLATLDGNTPDPPYPAPQVNNPRGFLGYLGIGADALIQNGSVDSSRTGNPGPLDYVLPWGKAMATRKNLKDIIRIYCDGGIVRPEALDGKHALTVLNIHKGYAGTIPWDINDPRFARTDMDNGLLQVMAVASWELAVNRAMTNHKATPIAQCRKLKIIVKAQLEMHMDGTRGTLGPGRSEINFNLKTKYPMYHFKPFFPSLLPRPAV